MSALLALALGAALQGPREPLPPYAESLRCAGLAEAAAGRQPTGSPEEKLYWDAGLFWGLTASEAARKDGIASERFKADQVAERVGATAELGTGDPATEAELAACMKRIKPIKPGG